MFGLEGGSAPVFSYPEFALSAFLQNLAVGKETTGSDFEKARGQGRRSDSFTRPGTRVAHLLA